MAMNMSSPRAVRRLKAAPVTAMSGPWISAKR